MPIFEYECPTCHVVTEHFVSTYGHDVSPVCHHSGSDAMHGIPQPPPAKCVRIMSAPCPPRMGGVAGKMHTAKKIRARNDAYFNSSHGQEEHRANVKAANKRVLGHE